MGEEPGLIGGGRSGEPDRLGTRLGARFRGWCVAERSGFEPEVGFDPHTALAMRRFRPLSHLSAVGWTGEGIGRRGRAPRSPGVVRSGDAESPAETRRVAAPLPARRRGRVRGVRRPARSPVRTAGRGGDADVREAPRTTDADPDQPERRRPPPFRRLKSTGAVSAADVDRRRFGG